MASTTPRFAGSPITSRPPLLRSRRAPRRRPLLLEALEQLLLPSTVTVSNYNDSGPGSLRAAILQVEGTTDATVNLPSTLSGNIDLNSPLLITQSVKISGPGANTLGVNGGLAYEDFDVELGQTDTVSISGLSIAQGSAPRIGPHTGEGGGLYFSGGTGSTLVLSNLSFSGNTAKGNAGTTGTGDVGGNAQGAGLYVSGGTVKINQCAISNNSATGGAGAAGGTGGNGQGGGLYVASGTVAITNTTIGSNKAVGGNGANGNPGGNGSNGAGSGGHGSAGFPGANGGNGQGGGDLRQQWQCDARQRHHPGQRGRRRHGRRRRPGRPRRPRLLQKRRRRRNRWRRR